MINFIINKNVNLECETIHGWRPIHFICFNKNENMINLIIDKGVSLKCKTISGLYPLDLIFVNENIKYETVLDKIFNENIDISYLNNTYLMKINSYRKSLI